jgi:riboflavin synthase
MFSGIVETLGIITHIALLAGCKYFTIQPMLAFTDIKLGDSIAVNGVCLTVTHFTHATVTFAAVPETLRLTNLNSLAVNQLVNLERALQLSARLGGHFVQGHIDGTGQILELHPDGSALLAKISIPRELAKYFISKGFIAIDGMSITVITAMPTWFSVTFIPHTQATTIVKHYKKHAVVNLEVDMLSKYMEKLSRGYLCNQQ